MIAHRLYSVEKLVPHRRVKSAGEMREELRIMTPKQAAWYVMQGYELFDYTESLEMDPIFYDQELELTMDQVYEDS